MARAELLKPFILKWEGGFVNDPLDRGGATNKGVTLRTFRAFFGDDKTEEDLRNITDEEWMHIFKAGFWNVCSADKIATQSIANIIVDWAWGSGGRNVVFKIQRLLGIVADGVAGQVTIRAINSANQHDLFNRIYEARKRFYNRLVEKDPSQARFINGWMNRLNCHKFEGWEQSKRY